ncbi:hypothetical protein D9M71_668530 [compost metagenome]
MATIEVNAKNRMTTARKYLPQSPTWLVSAFCTSMMPAPDCWPASRMMAAEAVQISSVSMNTPAICT